MDDLSDIEGMSEKRFCELSEEMYECLFKWAVEHEVDCLDLSKIIASNLVVFLKGARVDSEEARDIFCEMMKTYNRTNK